MAAVLDEFELREDPRAACYDPVHLDQGVQVNLQDGPRQGGGKWGRMTLTWFPTRKCPLQQYRTASSNQDNCLLNTSRSPGPLYAWLYVTVPSLAKSRRDPTAHFKCAQN